MPLVPNQTCDWFGRASIVGGEAVVATQAFPSFFPRRQLVPLVPRIGELDREGQLLSPPEILGGPEKAENWWEQDDLGFDSPNAEPLSVRPSEFVEFAVRIPDKLRHTIEAFSFQARPYLRRPYDTPHKRILLRFGRQTEKSTLLGNRALCFMSIIPNITVLYVSPTNMQTKQFSNDRINEPVQLSPALRAFTSDALTMSVFKKRFLNRSVMEFRHAYQNADRCRGIGADFVFVDEIQDILTNHLPVIEECASHSPYAYFSYSGTPKTFDNAIEYYWQQYSTRNEWVIPCRHHGLPRSPGTWYWNVITEENIGLSGLICDRCGERIYPDDPKAHWVAFNSEPRIGLHLVTDPFEGFHLSQLVVPWKQPEADEGAWQGILNKQAAYGRQKFYNEVLGESYDSGSRPLTEADIRRNCSSETMGFLPTFGEQFAYLREFSTHHGGSSLPVFAGIDWGEKSENSFTVLTLGAYVGADPKFTYFFSHRFEGPMKEPSPQMERIFRILDLMQPHVTVCDMGGGLVRNDQLIRRYGSDRIMLMQYSNPKLLYSWDGARAVWMVNRSNYMGKLFAAYKRGGVFKFPNWEALRHPFAEDMLGIFSEFSERTRMTVYKRGMNTPDDSFHSFGYAFFASTMVKPRPDIFSPILESGDEGC